MPEDAAWADPVVVPDDIRELQADVDAYQRELRHARRRMRWQRLTASPGWQRWGFPAGMLTGAVALAAVVFALLAVDGRTRPESSPGPLAHPTTAVGSVGGLLPDVTLTTTSGTKVGSRSLRPALVALLPVHCSCAATLRSLADQAAEVQLRLVVVAPQAPDAEVAALPGQLHYTEVIAAYDTGDKLARVYGSSAVTALILGRDGVVTYRQPDVTSGTRLEGPLQTALLLAPALSH